MNGKLIVKVLGNSSVVGAAPVEVRPGFVFAFDPSCADYDWLVVFDELPFDDRGTYRRGCEPLRCPPENTILCTWEPVSIKSYSRAYTRQFRWFLSNRPPEAEDHPGYRLGRGYFPWFHGHTLDELNALPPKTKTVSAVCSAKQMRYTQHLARYRLVSALAAEVSGFDWYGHGVKPIEKKSDALDPYKYHVAVENHIAPHHWTEKFADAILCECLPFYAGDPLLGEIFPKDCFIPIPIDDPAAAVRIVKEAIAADEYERRRSAILEAKELLLHRYNFIDQVIGIIRSAESASGVLETSAGTRIYSRRALRFHSWRALTEDVVCHVAKALRGFRRGT